MRKLAIATVVLGAVATLLTTAGASTAATGYDARAHMSGHRTCTKDARVGVTQRRIVLDNSRSAHRAQFKVVRNGDHDADPVVYVWVPAAAKKRVTVSVPQRTTVSVRVRVPEMGREDLRLSATVRALDSCYVARVAPKASLGGVSCQGSDSVAQIVLDNRDTTDEKVAYAVASSYGDSTASFTVRPASSSNYYLTVPTGRSTHVDVRAAGKRLLATDIAAVSCP
ncbi:hypothetical protein [Nocardioides mangrovi]|uniref:Uncharacterized protein n=1 Tax=Nocardioides mangrovi TaxID=2874580 RepID=A0ABS7UAQ4_9ACTN|nr:hypothetical protein [Nocardioides mangrovi]MBZ5737727.1 hypothetical protein [Nocardioides mangrovi]